jgi:hypothetical protein
MWYIGSGGNGENVVSKYGPGANKTKEHIIGRLANYTAV